MEEFSSIEKTKQEIKYIKIYIFDMSRIIDRLKQILVKKTFPMEKKHVVF